MLRKRKQSDAHPWRNKAGMNARGPRPLTTDEAVRCRALKDGKLCGESPVMFYQGAGAVCYAHNRELEVTGHVVLYGGKVLERASTRHVDLELQAFGPPEGDLERLSVGRHRTVIVVEHVDEDAGPLAGALGRQICEWLGLAYPLELARWFQGIALAWVYSTEPRDRGRTGALHIPDRLISERMGQICAALRETRRITPGAPAPHDRYDVLTPSSRVLLWSTTHPTDVWMRLSLMPGVERSVDPARAREWWVERLHEAQARERRALTPPPCLECGAHEINHENGNAGHAFREEA